MLSYVPADKTHARYMLAGGGTRPAGKTVRGRVKHDLLSGRFRYVLGLNVHSRWTNVRIAMSNVRMRQ